MKIVKFDNQKHRKGIISLWKTCFGYTDKRNNPELVIDKKLVHDDLLFVAVDGDRVLGSIMLGYDGHRGWIYSLAVDAAVQGSGIGGMLLDFGIAELKALGCMKVNLQVMPDNTGAVEFYKKTGFELEERISMGIEISANVPG